MSKIKKYPSFWLKRHRTGNIRDHPQRYHINVGKRYSVGNFNNNGGTVLKGYYDENNKFEVDVIGGEYVEKPPMWVNHRRSKNYIAHVVGLDNKFGFKRDFLDRVRLGKKTYFKKEDFIPEEIYDMRFVYYTGGGNPVPELEAFMKCVSNDGKKVVFEEISTEDVISEMKKKYGTSAKEISVGKKRKEIEKKLAEDLEKAKKRLEEAKKEKEKTEKEIQILDEATKEIKAQTPKINEAKLNVVKKKLNEEVINISKRLVKTGSKKYNTRIYSSNGIEIKEENGNLKYVKVDGMYVFSQYDNEVGLKALYNSYKKLKNRERERVKEIEEIGDGL